MGPDPRTKWIFKAPCGVYHASPALSQDEQTVYFGTGFGCTGAPDYSLYAFSADTGSPIWRYALGSDPVVSSPVVAADDSIYFVAAPYRLVKLDAGGNLLWEVSINPSGAIPPLGHAAPALGQDGTVYVAGDRLYAIAQNGTVSWFSSLEPFGTEAMHNSPVIAPDGTVYFGFHNFYLSAFNGATGATQWSLTNVPFGYNFAAPVLAADGTVYLPSDGGGLYAVSSTGTLDWTFPDNAAYFLRSSPAIDAGGDLYFGSTAALTAKAGVFAVRPDGSQKWFTIPPDIADDPTPANHFDFNSAPALGADGNLYVGHKFGSIYGFDPATGSVVWQYKVNAGIMWSSPAISAKGVLYIGTLDGDLLAVQTESLGLSSTAVWPKYRFDNQNTGRMH